MEMVLRAFIIYLILPVVFKIAGRRAHYYKNDQFRT